MTAKSLMPEMEWPTMALAFGPPREATHHAIESLAVTPLVRAGLFLRFDFFDESHAISQDNETVEGSYWHAILHRREPDAGNAKYWLRRVGRHPIHDQLSFDGLPWDAFRFVDLCERHRGRGDEMEAKLIAAQAAEWQALFDWCRERNL